ncbi:START domain-containing protein 10 [Capsella rubella]|nr:START domain-containing protein 10 [Capsella rubella]
MNGPVPSSSSWSVSEESLRRYVRFASESCIQELLSSSEAGRSGNATNGWKIVRHDPTGVEISKRDTGSLHSFRSRRILTSVSPDQFVKVANAIDAAKQWEGDLVEATHIREIDENLSVIRLRFGENSKPLFRNREFIVYERRETMQDGTLVVAVASLPKEMAEGLEPTKKKKHNSFVRGFLVESGWVLEKLEDTSCMITYVVQLDPVGWLPKCFVNRLNTKLVMIIDSLRKLAQASLPNSLPPT